MSITHVTVQLYSRPTWSWF